MALSKEAVTILAGAQTRSKSTQQPLMHRILHGNQEAQEEIKTAVETREVNFSQKIARGKYIHEIMTHSVKPECLKEYLELVYALFPLPSRTARG